MGDVMELDEVNGQVNGTSTVLPEIEMYLGLVVTLYLHDHKHYGVVKS